MSSKKTGSGNDKADGDRSASPHSKKNAPNESEKKSPPFCDRQPYITGKCYSTTGATDLLKEFMKAAEGSRKFPSDMNFQIKFPIPEFMKTLSSPTVSMGQDIYTRDINGLPLLPYQSRDLLGKVKPVKLHPEQTMNATRERKLRSCACLNNTEMLEKYLLDHVDPNSTDSKKRTALHISAAKGYDTVVNLLLQHGANPNQKDINGNTPLHLAACTSNFAVVTILLNAGTNIEEYDNAGYSPLHLAKAKLHMLKKDKASSSQDIKDQVSMIVEMMQTYLQRSGNSAESDLILSFNKKLSISNSRKDVDDNLDGLLDSLKNLNIS